MDKKERLMAVLNGTMPDRPPVGLWFHFTDAESRGEACVQAHVRTYKQSNVDFVKIMSDGLLYPVRQRIDCAADWAKLAPLPRDDAFFADTVERCARIHEELGEECCLFYNFFSPFTMIRAAESFTEHALAGRTKDETVMAHLRENEAAVLHALEVVAADLAHLAELVIHRGGCLGIYQSVQGAEKGRMSEEEHRRWIAPSDLMVLKAANLHSQYNILHMCSWAGFANHLEYWKDYPARVKNWGTGVEGLPLATGKSWFPGSVLLGGLDNRRGFPLVSGTKAQLQQAVRELVTEMGPTPFILGADCTVPSDFELERAGWILEALETQ